MILAALTALTLVPCEPVRIMDEGPHLSGTRTVCVAVSPHRSRILEDPADYTWAPAPLSARLEVGVTAATWDYQPGTFRMLANAGTKWTRVDIVAAELDNPAYVAHVDRVVADARTNRLRVLGTLWGSEGRLADVPSVGWYVGRARLAASRWRLDGWEVWNEPDARLFWHGTPEQYGRLLRAVYPVLHARAPVVHAGLAHSDPRWLRRSIRAGARFDVLGAHPYPAKHTDSPARTLRKLTPLHRITRKPVWITELGWSTYSGGVSEAQQARNVTSTLRILRARYSYVRRVFFFEGRDTGTDDRWLSRLGLLRRDLTAKPALFALGG